MNKNQEQKNNQINLMQDMVFALNKAHYQLFKYKNEPEHDESFFHRLAFIDFSRIYNFDPHDIKKHHTKSSEERIEIMLEYKNNPKDKKEYERLLGVIKQIEDWGIKEDAKRKKETEKYIDELAFKLQSKHMTSLIDKLKKAMNKLEVKRDLYNKKINDALIHTATSFIANDYQITDIAVIANTAKIVSIKDEFKPMDDPDITPADLTTHGKRIATPTAYVMAHNPSNNQIAVVRVSDHELDPLDWYVNANNNLTDDNPGRTCKAVPENDSANIAITIDDDPIQYAEFDTFLSQIGKEHNADEEQSMAR